VADEKTSRRQTEGRHDAVRLEMRGEADGIRDAGALYEVSESPGWCKVYIGTGERRKRSPAIKSTLR
jgi:hypothetical protein